MRARALIANAAFGPDTMKVIGRAFDDAWAEIAGNFSDQAQIEAVRLKMANAILAAAGSGADVESLEVAALRAAVWDVL